MTDCAPAAHPADFRDMNGPPLSTLSYGCTLVEPRVDPYLYQVRFVWRCSSPVACMCLAFDLVDVGIACGESQASGSVSKDSDAMLFCRRACSPTPLRLLALVVRMCDAGLLCVVPPFVDTESSSG